MATLSKAPLIEVIFEVRWGKITPQDNGRTLHISFTDTEKADLLKNLETESSKYGFPFVEIANNLSLETLPPYVPIKRFRPVEGMWPCYQAGVGIFTVNQLNDGYVWENYAATVKNGLNLLDTAHPEGISALAPVALALKYVDGYLLDAGQSPTDYIRQNLQVNLDLPGTLLNTGKLGDEVLNPSFGFQLRTQEPVGVADVSVKTGSINGSPGLISTTTVTSNKDALPDNYCIETITDWTEAAHKLHQIIFKELPTAAKMKEFE
ncbi:MAG: TIGR04255 family protein [Deltaproteobacteria bacterium]|nr:TIGR04255 family protein [Deltaproteobacteria bacterium]